VTTTLTVVTCVLKRQRNVDHIQGASFCNNLAFCESSKMLAVSDMTRSGRVTMYEVFLGSGVVIP